MDLARVVLPRQSRSLAQAGEASGIEYLLSNYDITSGGPQRRLSDDAMPVGHDQDLTITVRDREHCSNRTQNRLKLLFNRSTPPDPT
jgi:hypothetical protein